MMLSREEALGMEARRFQVEYGTREDVASARPGLTMQRTKVALYLRLLSRPMNKSLSQRENRVKMLTYVRKLHVRLQSPISISFSFRPALSNSRRSYSPEFGESPASHLDP
jgi:hypothetical protein